MPRTRYALIPAYMPGRELITFVDELTKNEFEVIIVDDGSGEQCKEIFDNLSKKALVLTQDHNRGKGAALKRGLQYIKENGDKNSVVVTLDADGQHTIDDAIRVCENSDKYVDKLIIGSRSFNGKVPFRSQFGNSITKFIFHLATGKSVSDTQTGLRGFAFELIPLLLSVEGERYEYEMNMLLECVISKIDIFEVPIKTIYINDNSSSHFNAISDSYRIYKQIFKYIGMRRKNIWPILYGVFLAGFTVYIALDTFVLERTYVDLYKDEEIRIEREEIPDLSDVHVTEDSYKDDNISILLTTCRKHDTTIYSADIQISNPKYLKTAFARNTYGKNITETTSTIAKEVNAILAINGDFYGVREANYVVRNGKVYRDIVQKNHEDLVIYADGRFEIIKEDEITIKELLEQGAVDVLSFGPALVIDGKINVTKDQEVGVALANNPRTAIGIIDEGHYIFVVGDGRTNESEGLSLYELAEFMLDLGVKTAYNLDGGGSSTLVFNGKVINKPTFMGDVVEERSVSDIVYIGY